MDSQHRHELEQNDLAEAITGLGKWWAKWGNTVLVVVLIAAVSFTLYNYLRQRAIAAHEQAWRDLALETSPGGLQQLARTASDPTVKAMAYLRAGDMQLAEALIAPPATPTPTPEPAAEPSAEGETAAPIEPQAGSADASTLLGDAAANYEQALRLAPNVAIKANALLGLASVAEAQLKFDDAAEHYREVLDIAGDHHPMFVAQAQSRLDSLDEMRTPVRFAPAPPPAETAGLAPEAASPDSQAEADAVDAPAAEGEPVESEPAPEGAATPTEPVAEPAPLPEAGAEGRAEEPSSP